MKTLTVAPVQHASTNTGILTLEGSVEGIRGLHAMRHGVLEVLPYYTLANQSQVRVGLTQP